MWKLNVHIVGLRGLSGTVTASIKQAMFKQKSLVSDTWQRTWPPQKGLKYSMFPIQIYTAPGTQLQSLMARERRRCIDGARPQYQWPETTSVSITWEYGDISLKRTIWSWMMYSEMIMPGTIYQKNWWKWITDLLKTSMCLKPKTRTKHDVGT